MTDDLTAGDFQALTGLTAKALRLYADRGIVVPAWVDPASGYRYYSRAQLQHGATVDLLRRAQVPLSELGAAADFDFARWRDTVAMRRHVEDFSLAVAEKVSTFDAADFTAHSTPAPAVDWVGVIIDLDIPTDAEDRIEAFTGLAADTPAIERAMHEALSALGAGPAAVCWSAVPDTGVRNAGNQMLLARAGATAPGSAGVATPNRATARPIDRAALARIEAHVLANTGSTVTAVTGTLPARLEVTFTAASAGLQTPVDEAAAGYLHLLAFEQHLARHGLVAIRPTARQVVRGPTLFPADVPTAAAAAHASAPVGVFDVHAG